MTMLKIDDWIDDRYSDDALFEVLAKINDVIDDSHDVQFEVLNCDDVDDARNGDSHDGYVQFDLLN